MEKPQQTSFKYHVERAEASYYPGSFYIKLNESTIKIVEGKGAVFEDPNKVCVFLHEYSHLVQDMTSLFGAFRFFQRINALEDLKKLCEASDDVLIPLSQFVEDGRAISTGDDSAYAQYLELESFFEQQNTWEPNIDHKFRSYTIEYKRFSWLKDDGGHPITLERPKVTFETIDGFSPTISFGSFEIHEAYSIAVEEVFNKKPDSNSRPFEYRAARRIIEAKMGSVISPQKLIAICHWSLQSLSPGKLFFDLIDNLCSQPKTAIISDEQFFDCCKNYVLHNTNYIKIREYLLKTLLKQYEMQTSVTRDNLFAQALDWYYKSANRLLHINDATLDRFPLNTLLCNNIKPFSEGWVDLFTFVPIPQVEDMNGSLFSFGGTTAVSEQSVFLFRVLTETINNLWFGETPTWACSITKACKHPIKDKMCDTTPWIRGKNLPTCSQGAVAIYLAIHNKSIKYAHHGKPFVPLVPDH